MFNEHPADHYDYVTDGHRGNRDGVLLIPGAEQKGLLLFPQQSLRGIEPEQPQELSDVVRGRGGLAFLSHLEERMDWELKGLTGVEIYNTHADVKDEKRLVAAMRSPLWLLGAAESFRKYPQEAFSALHDYPADYVRRWDELCQLAPHTGIAANDAHENVGIVVRLTNDGRARIEDALGEKLLEVDVSAIAETGSISASAKRLGMSYRRAWLLVDTMNRCFREPVVASATGGAGGGGARLTPFGREVMKRFDAMRRAVDRALDPELSRFSELLR